MAIVLDTSKPHTTVVHPPLATGREATEFAEGETELRKLTFVRTFVFVRDRNLAPKEFSAQREGC